MITVNGGGNTAFIMGQCHACKRKILVEATFPEKNEPVAVIMNCAECIKIHDDFRAALPDVAREIDEWMKS